MLKNNIKIAWRSLKKQPFITCLNIVGLAIGMAGGILISLYVLDELSYDTMFKDADRIFRIDTDIRFGGAEIAASEAAAPLAAALERDIAQVETTVRFMNQGSLLLRKEGTRENYKERHTTFVDSTFFDMFGLQLEAGDSKTALTQPHTLVLTRSAADKYFGNENPVGQTLLLNNSETYRVTGVIGDMPENSFLRNHSVFLSMAGYTDSRSDHWGNTNYYTLVKLIPGTDIDDFEAALQGMFTRYVLPWAQIYFPGISEESFKASGDYIRYHTMPLTDIHLHSSRQSELSANNSIQNVYILSLIGFFLIALACVNFMNLSTAHSLQRAREVGIRKTLGSDRTALVRQFLTESGLTTFLSLILALLATILVLPYFNELSGKSITLPFTSPIFWLAIFFATLVLGLISGSYPAFFMSGFRPVSVLKGAGSEQVGGARIRNSLVVFQFAISVFLILSTLVVFQQVNFIQNKDLGFSKEQVLLIEDVYAAGNQSVVFKEEVARLAGVEHATISSYFPTPSSRSNGSYYREGAMDQEHAIQMQNWYVDSDYIPTLDMELIAGRNFDPLFPTDSAAVIVNEATLKVMGVEAREAVGMRISQDIELEEPEYATIIGVVRDFHYESLRENIAALGLFLDNSAGMLAARLNPGDFQGTIAQIETLWNTIAPGQPFSYSFLDESFNATYETEQRLGRIFMVFTVLSILIASLGLFGLAAFNAQKRTKEIGIRKVLGASASQITYRLATDFLKMVGLAIVISLPAGWIAMERWLQDFTYRIEISWWVFAVAALLAVAIALLTIGYQSIRAAVANPVKSLRTE